MKQTDQISDSDIINLIVHGQKALYELIVRRYNSTLYKVGRSFNFNHEDTQDLMQDTYVNTFKNLESFRGQSNFKTWIIRIMLNNCYHKKQRSSYKYELAQENINENLQPMFTHSDNDANRQIQNKELGRFIEEGLEKLPEDYRIVFTLREINGLNVAQTAELLAISEGNVKVRLNRAKLMLRKELEKSYSNVELFEFNLIYCDSMVNRVMIEIENL